MVTAVEAERLRQAQQGLVRLMEDDLASFWGALDLTRPEAARDALAAYVPALVDEYGQMAATVAADWYDERRAVEGVPGRFRAVAVASPYRDAVGGTLARASGALFTDHPELALAGMGRLFKYVRAAGRSTIQESSMRDPQAVGWQRVVRPGACDFCRLLHGRGGVYKRETAFFASHDDCNCAAVPSWDPSAPEVDVEAYAASTRMTALRERAAAGDPSAVRSLERHRNAVRDYIEHMH